MRADLKPFKSALYIFQKIQHGKVHIMNILIIGDIFGDCGLNYTNLVLREIKQDYDIDFCIANAENVSGGNGITFGDYHTLCEAGVDAFTLGNHTFGKKDIVKLFENENQEENGKYYILATKK